MARSVIYARYSSDLQSSASIEDQIRICTTRAEHEGWTITLPYSDYAISGASMFDRTGLQALMADAAAGQFDIVVTEGLDRLSRDQEDIAGIYKRLSYAGVKIFSLSDGGFINELHIGLKGTMNSLFLKDLGLKTHRGQRGRVEKGKAGSGAPAYGYDIVKRFDEKGEPVRGERTINEEQAQIVNRIFKEYAAGKSPVKICTDLNREHIPNANGGTWSPNTVIGLRSMGSGMINNQSYIGRIVWNKQSFVKNPDTGKRVGRANPRDQWVSSEVPALRIIDQALWDKAKARQEKLAKQGDNHARRRPKGLFSYLLKCGCCERGFSKVSATRYGCSSAYKKGACDNRKTILESTLENIVLQALQTKLMAPELLDDFCKAYTLHLAYLKKQYGADAAQAHTKINKLDAEKAKLIEAIKQGIPASEIKGEFTRITQQRAQAQQSLNHQNPPKISLPTNMAQRYNDEVETLRARLNTEKYYYEAADIIRSLIDKIVLTPDKATQKLRINLHGDLAGLLSLASGAELKQEDWLTQSFFNQAQPKEARAKQEANIAPW